MRPISTWTERAMGQIDVPRFDRHRQHYYKAQYNHHIHLLVLQFPKLCYSIPIYVYIYIYVCVCVCARVCMHVWMSGVVRSCVVLVLVCVCVCLFVCVNIYWTLYWVEALSSKHDDVIKWKPFSRYWPFVRGIHRPPVNSLHKGQWRGALMFSLICAWINGSVNYREDPLWRHCNGKRMMHGYITLSGRSGLDLFYYPTRNASFHSIFKWTTNQCHYQIYARLMIILISLLYNNYQFVSCELLV